jgi:16S rRNA (cytidine1402-2'-O)-methyltransferase
MGTLYLVSTPIGNLEDITLRGLRVLREASLIAAEDTRHTRRLLNRYEITTPCLSYHEHNRFSRIDDILTALAGGDVALVSDAGTPTLSDPGFELVRVCIEAGFAVLPVPGPSAPIAALVASGLPTDRFLYIGFLPRRSTERRKLFTDLAPLPATIVCFETPHRLIAALADARQSLGDREIVIARELTKQHEQWLRLRMSEAQEHFREQRPRGEFTLVIAGAAEQHTRRQAADGTDQQVDETATPPPPSVSVDENAIMQRLQELRQAGQRGSAAARTVAQETGLPRRAIYALWLDMTAAPDEDADLET